MTRAPRVRPTCTLLLDHVGAYLAPQYRFLLELGTLPGVRRRSGQLAALLGLVLIPIKNRHAISVRPWRQMRLFKIARFAQHNELKPTRPKAAYLNLILMTSEWLHVLHSNVRRSWAGS